MIKAGADKAIVWMLVGDNLLNKSKASWTFPVLVPLIIEITL